MEGGDEFMTPTPDYGDSEIRRKATARAAMMMKLFNKNAFQKIMEAVDPPPIKEPAFTNACKNFGKLEDSEIAWLKAYLENCKQAVYDTIPEAASSGW
jgi:nitrogenase molybdenum-iron protein alpha/beta subunit